MTVAPPAPQAASGPKTNTMALVSLIAGILGLTLFPLLGSIAAVITGNIGRKEIAASNGAETGDGLAMAGLIMGWIGIGLGVLGICVACLCCLCGLFSLLLWYLFTFGDQLFGLAWNVAATLA